MRLREKCQYCKLTMIQHANQAFVSNGNGCHNITSLATSTKHATRREKIQQRTMTKTKNMTTTTNNLMKYSFFYFIGTVVILTLHSNLLQINSFSINFQAAQRTPITRSKQNIDRKHAGGLSIYVQSGLSLSISSTTTTTSLYMKSPIQKIAIIGCGISGLSLAHALINNKKDSNNNNIQYQIDIFESRNGLDTRTGGAGVQLNGGLITLGLINKQLQQSVYNAGIPVDTIESRCIKWTSSNSNSNENSNEKRNNNKSLNDMDTLFKFNLYDTIKNAGGTIAETLLLHQKDSNTNNNNNNYNSKMFGWIAIMRNTLQQVLYDTLDITNNKNVRVHFGQSLQSFYYDNNKDKNSGIVCNVIKTTKDDSTSTSTENIVMGPFDMIIGCDGINSQVKSFIDTGRSTTSNNKQKQFALYSGIRIRYAVADGNTNNDNNHNSSKDQTTKLSIKETPTSLNQYFGDSVYALHGRYGTGYNQPTSNCSFIVYLDKDYVGPFRIASSSSSLSQSSSSLQVPTTTEARITIPKKTDDDENVDWSQDSRQPNDNTRTTMINQIIDQGNIPLDIHNDPLGQTIINANRFFDLGVYFHNPFGKWYRSVTTSTSTDDSNYYAVVCGDAAHACPPFLGQGSNQAIQDAYCLATTIHKYNTQMQQKSNINYNNNNDISLQTMLQEQYQNVRFSPTFSIFWKSLFLGYLETGGTNGIYSKVRDITFKTLGVFGIAQKVLLSAAMPKVTKE